MAHKIRHPVQGEKTMSAASDVFESFKDETGEEYYCPIKEGADRRAAAAPEIEDCVEASTAGRYSGNLNVVERFTRRGKSNGGAR
jgi:hypothetical protein